MTEPKELATELEAIANLVHRLTPDHRRDPARYHADRDDAEQRLRTIVRALRGEVRRRPSTTWRA